MCVYDYRNSFIGKLGFAHNPDGTYLKIFKTSLKAVLFHNGNKRPSIHFKQAVDMEEIQVVNMC